MNGNKSKNQQNDALNFIHKEIPKLKKLRNLEKFNDSMQQIKEMEEKAQLGILQKFAILFYSIYNELSFKEQNKDIQRLIKLADYMINSFKKDDILNQIQSEINKNFSEEDFKNHKIFEDRYTTKDSLEICFAICILSKNINLMKIFFKEYLKVNLFMNENLIQLI